jgi:ATP-dependent Clp protease protease subunit
LQTSFDLTDTPNSTLFCYFARLQVNPSQASVIIAQLLYLESVDATRPIQLYINSPGGTVTDGFAIYDTIQYIRSPVHTVAMGLAASMGSLLLTAGTKGHRMALPNARIMIHQPHGGAQGQASDIAIQAQEILYTRRRLNETYAKHTGKPIELIERSMERDYFMSPQEAVEFGLIDKVIEKREQ